MNDERNSADSGHDDQLVSATYRELANERPSDALNASVLRQAATAAKPRYLRSMSWMRPTAWAATIGLCFAIALEVTRVPQPDSAVFSPPADAVDQRAVEDQQLENENSTEFLEESIRQNMPSSKSEIDTALGVDANFPATVPAPARARSTEKKRADEPVLTREARKTSVPSVADEFIIKDTEMMRDAEDIARARNGSNQEVSPVQGRSLSAAAFAIEPAPACDKETTSRPSAWLECIRELEDAGQSDEAGRQREQLKLAFPDFELP